MSDKIAQLKVAADEADWGQVAMNHPYGPPCFLLGDDHVFCLRAKGWDGHGRSHKYVSLADLIESVAKGSHD